MTDCDVAFKHGCLSEPVIILFENDVPCATDGYAKLATLQNNIGIQPPM